MVKNRCELCLKKAKEVHLTCISKGSALLKLRVCEKCYEKINKQEKKKKKYE
jgi:ribosome-binding protein aMBF1 (putative translation factor)